MQHVGKLQTYACKMHVRQIHVFQRICVLAYTKACQQACMCTYMHVCDMHSRVHAHMQTCIDPYVHEHECTYTHECMYGVAMISRLPKITGLFCKRALFKRPYSANENYNFKEPANRSYPICIHIVLLSRTREQQICMH